MLHLSPTQFKQLKQKKPPRFTQRIKRVEYRKDGSIKRVVIPETKLVSDALLALQNRGFICWRNNAGNYHGMRLAPAGAPDVIGWIPPHASAHLAGKFFGVEFKVGKNTQSEFQKRFELRMREEGCIYILAYSVKEMLDQLDSYTKNPSSRFNGLTKAQEMG